MDIRFENCDLSNADFNGARLENCVLRGVRLNDSDRGFWAQYGAAECRLEDVRWGEEAEAALEA